MVAGVFHPTLLQWFFIFSTCLAWLPPSPGGAFHERTRRRQHVDGVSASESTMQIRPPVPHRDESSYVLAGDVSAPISSSSESFDSNALLAPPPIPMLLRQSPSSPHQLLSPPRRIPNPYGWMRDDDRTNTTILNHLHAENEYSRQMTEHLDGLREELYQEFLASIQETDYTTPSLKTSPNGKGYWYYTRLEEGEGYPRYCRAPQQQQDSLFPPPANADWGTRIMNTSNETSYAPLFANEEVYLDVPSLARNRTYLAMGAIAVSPNQKYVAYSLDVKGGESCQLYVKHIESGQVWALYNHQKKDRHAVGNELLECDGSIVWNDESDAVFYLTMDDKHRPNKLYRRQIFDSHGHWIDKVGSRMEEEDDLLLEEKDELFNLRISKSFDGKFLLATCSSKECSEVHYLDLQSTTKDRQGIPSARELVCIAKRQPNVLYRVAHCEGYWLVQTNLGGLPNLSLKACRVGNGEMANWKDVMRNDADNHTSTVFDGGHDCSLDGVTVFKPSIDSRSHTSPLAYAAITGREEGMPRVWILELDKGKAPMANNDSRNVEVVVTKMTRLEFDEDAYDVGIGGNRDPRLPYVVISYDSLITPPSHIAIPLANPSDLSSRVVLKEKNIPGYDKELYSCERTLVRSRDGKTDIPVSLVYHRDVLQLKKNGAIPTHLYGYGSYGASIEASFRSTRLPLLNRKIVYALAHVRGGGEMGRPWYDGAKYLTKKNSFNDFVDVARWLVRDEDYDGSSENDGEPISLSIGRGITTSEKLSCEGRSAGGLLIGSSINQQPDLFCAALLGVPFVDVACTMVDATIPLTVAEWEEWGNPNEENFFDYIMSYSPIDNVRHGAVYPSCLITGGLHDPRVQYWEPAKFVAELRHQTSNKSGPVLLKMDMDSGHFSGSDRYRFLRDLAFEYAFLMDALECTP